MNAVSGPVQAAPLLEVTGLRVTLRSRAETVTAVDGIDLQLRSGHTLGLVGESGSGKSVTALTILGLAPETAGTAIEGTIRLNGIDLRGLDERGLRRVRGRQIGIVFQDPASCLNPIMRVGEQIVEAVRAGAAGNGMSARDRAVALLREAGLPSPAEAYRAFPHELSGGQQQRAMIAMALACDPELLIADEPTTALDMTIQKQILDLLCSLQQARRMAMLFISHDLGVIARVAHEVAVMRHGRIVEHGPVGRVFGAPSHPYTRALLACRPSAAHRGGRLPVAADIAEGAEPAVAREALPSWAKAASGAALEVEGLSVTYRRAGLFGDRIPAVRDVSFAIEAGRCLGIVGESGSGKSTVAKAIIGLVRASTGIIRLFGEALPADGRRESRHYRRCQIIMQQAAAAMNPRFTVAQTLAEPLDVHGLRCDRGRQRFLIGLLTEVGLPETMLTRYPHELSGGQCQRINIARALTVDPALLLCDEIVSSLDMSVQASVLNLLKDIQRSRGLTLAFISHDLSVISFIAEDLIVMRDGIIVESGPTLQILEAPSTDYVKQLLESVP